MGAKLEAGSYSNRSGFEADFRLMIANAQQYNMPNSFVHDVATEMAALFDRRMFLHAHITDFLIIVRMGYYRAEIGGSATPRDSPSPETATGDTSCPSSTVLATSPSASTETDYQVPCGVHRDRKSIRSLG